MELGLSLMVDQEKSPCRQSQRKAASQASRVVPLRVVQSHGYGGPLRKGPGIKSRQVTQSHSAWVPFKGSLGPQWTHCNNPNVPKGGEGIASAILWNGGVHTYTNARTFNPRIKRVGGQLGLHGEFQVAQHS